MSKQYIVTLLVTMKSEVSEVAQSCPTLCDPVNCSPPGYSVHGNLQARILILQARILEWVAISSGEMPSWMTHKQGINIAGRNINNLRYASDTTLMAESEEELESLLMKVKEESEKAGLKLNI